MSKMLMSTSLAILILLLCYTTSCTAQNNSSCIRSSCGEINIRYPFRLRDDPPNCAHPDPIFVLECHENRTIINSRSKKYHVLAIIYSNFSIRISDPGLDVRNYSSCPLYSSPDKDLYSSYMYENSNYHISVTFLNCLRPVNDSLYIENPFCGNTTAFSNTTRVYSYLMVGSILVPDLEESCTYDTTIDASWPGPRKADNNYSYAEVHDILGYGFEFTWFPAMCTGCNPDQGTCLVENNKIICRHYCFEHTSLEDRTFICKLEYYGVYIYIACLAIGGLICARFVFGIPLVIVFVVRKWRRRDSSMRQSEAIDELIKHQTNFMPIKYSYGEIKKMTNNFKTKLGIGPHGTVYRGKLRSGTLVAIKMLKNASGSDKEFVSNVCQIARIGHLNVVKLTGFCIKGRKRAVVHEFMTSGSVDKHTTSLSYIEMFKISLGVARGLECLHEFQICHLGVKPQNILLDKNLSPKISDPGLAQLDLQHDHKTAVIGKMGFAAPEVFYKNIGEVSCKADVYSFGMLVLEMAEKLKELNLCANGLTEVYFPLWIYNKFCEEKDVGIEDEEAKMVIAKTMLAALWCIQVKPSDRPSMKEVVAMLEGEIELLQMPAMPFHRAMDQEMIQC